VMLQKDFLPSEHILAREKKLAGGTKHFGRDWRFRRYTCSRRTRWWLLRYGPSTNRWRLQSKSIRRGFGVLLFSPAQSEAFEYPEEKKAA
jgi:hypothetical protein